jgi:hypothetical protein
MAKSIMQRSRRVCPASRSRLGDRSRSGPAGLVIALSFVAFLSCSSDRDANEKRLAELRDEMTRVQNASDRLEDRVSALEVSAMSTARANAAAAPAPEAAPVYRPRLKVVHVTPENPQVAPEPDNANPERSANDGR